MDIRKTGFHGRLELPGKSDPIDLSGSIIGIWQEALKALQACDSRSQKKQIILTVADYALTAEGIKQQRELEDAMQYFDQSLVRTEESLDGESLEEMTVRLQEQGYSRVSAEMNAYKAFGLDYEMPDKLLQWQNDPLAQRFRWINMSQRRYNESDPTDAAYVESYCFEHYPEYAKNVTLRK